MKRTPVQGYETMALPKDTRTAILQSVFSDPEVSRPTRKPFDTDIHTTITVTVQFTCMNCMSAKVKQTSLFLL